MRILNIKKVCDKTGLSRATIYRMVERREFPPPIQISRRRIGWLESEVDEWISRLLPVGA